MEVQIGDQWQLTVVMLVALLSMQKAEAIEFTREFIGTSEVQYEASQCEEQPSICVFRPETEAIANVEKQIMDGYENGCGRKSEYQFDHEIKREVGSSLVNYITSAKANFHCSVSW